MRSGIGGLVTLQKLDVIRGWTLSFLTLWIAFGLMGSLVKNLYAWMFARFMCGALRDDEFKRTFEFG